MADVRFVLREEIDWTDAMVIVAFPTAGMAASIASHYLRRHLELPLVGSVHLDDQSAVVAVQAGIATSPMRIHGGAVECRLGEEKCPSIYLISCDLPLQPAALQRVGEAILQETRGARLVLCLDAVVRDADDDTPDVYCTSPDSETLARLAIEGVEPVKEALVVGMSAQLLLESEANGLPAGAILVEAARDVPDGRAAAALVQAVDQLLPAIKIDPGPLLKEALELEEQVAEAQAKVERTQGAKTPSHTYI